MRRALSITAAAGLLLLAAWSALPAALGGPTSYVTTHGISMEPRFHTGDLAVLRSTRDYRVGDVAAYRSDQLKTVVMHRIIKIDHGRYSFKGDNNSFVDHETPTRDRLIGKLAVRVPHGGRWLRLLASPTGIAALALGLLMVGGADRNRRSRRRQRMSRHAHPRHRHPLALSSAAPTVQVAAAVAAVSAVLALFAGVLGWSGPATHTVMVTSPVTQEVAFAYSATVGKTPAYDGIEVHSPDPVFRRLARSVKVTFRYSGKPATVTVRAELTAVSGWRASVPLTGPSRVDGTRYDGAVTLDLTALQQRLDAAAAATGIPAEQASVSVVPRFVTADGTVFAPRLPLTLTPLQLSLAGAPSALSVSRTDPLRAPAVQPRTVGAAGHDIGIAAVRSATFAVALFALLAVAATVLLLWLGGATAESTLLLRRHASLIVDVEPVSLPAGRPVVDVRVFTTLVRIAERYGLLITRWNRAGVDTFLVHDEGATYRYRAGHGAASAARDAVTDGRVAV